MKPAAIVFCAAVLPRLAYLLLIRPPTESQYWALAGSLVRTGTFTIDGLPVTDFEPLYPLFLAGARLVARDSVLAVQLMQIAVASLGAVLLYRLVLGRTGSPRAAVIAGLLFAGYPLLVRHAATVGDSSLTTVLLVGFAGAATSIAGAASAAIAGVWLGLSVLSRAMVLPLVALVAAVLVWRGQARDAVVVAGVALLLVLPWWIRNQRANGSWWPTRSGINLFIGNSPFTAALVPDYDLDLLEPVAYELAATARPDIVPGSADYIPRIDAYLTSAAIERMKASPVRTITEKLANAGYFLSPRLVPLYVSGPETRVTLGPSDTVVVEAPVTRPRIEVISHTLAASFVLLAALAGVYARRHLLSQDAVLWAIAGVFVVVYAVYVPATRYRAPMEFVFFFYAAVALARIMPNVGLLRVFDVPGSPHTRHPVARASLDS
jgi:hypothetical protein